MNWWNVLEISYDSDIKTIKKAYSKLLKINNPEDNAEGYQKLREAYDAAIKYAKKNNKNQGNQEVININNEENVIVDNGYIFESYLNKDKQISHRLDLDNNERNHDDKKEKLNLSEQIAQFLNRLNDIYRDLHLRSDPAVWEELLNSAVLWDLEAFSIIENEVFDFLTKHKYLSAEIWTKLNNNFSWSQNEMKLYNKYSYPMVDEFIKNLKEPSELKYDYIKSINPEVADEYLYEREQAEKALKNKKYADAYNYLQHANSLFKGDPELLRLKGDYNYNIEHLETALECYKTAFEINNYDLNSALHIGIILVLYKRFSEAMTYLSIYSSYNNNDKLALKYIAYCYYYNDNLMMAKENFQKLLGFDENNKTTKKYLKNIEAQLSGKPAKKIVFDRDDLIKDEVVEKENNAIKKFNMKEKIHRNMKYTTKYLIRIIIVLVMFYASGHASVLKNSSNNNNTQKSITYGNKNNTNINANAENNNKEASKSLEKTILDPKKNSNVTMNLNNVKATNYYKISDLYENRSIFSYKELEEKGLRDKVESQLYVGSTKENVVIFADSKCSDKTINENGGYRISGAVCVIDEEIGNEIMKENAPDYQGLDWIFNGFIDASQSAKNSKK